MAVWITLGAECADDKYGTGFPGRFFEGTDSTRGVLFSHLAILLPTDWNVNVTTSMSLCFVTVGIKARRNLILK